MKKIISAKLAGDILLVAMGLFLVFHVLVLLKIAPANIIWGGQANPANIFNLEIVALTVTLFFGLIIANPVLWTHHRCKSGVYQSWQFSRSSEHPCLDHFHIPVIEHTGKPRIRCFC